MYEITILLKTKKSDGTAETIELTYLKKGKKIYRQLIKQWNKKKAISIPMHCVSVASDLVHSIFVR